MPYMALYRTFFRLIGATLCVILNRRAAAGCPRRCQDALLSSDGITDYAAMSYNIKNLHKDILLFLSLILILLILLSTKIITATLQHLLRLRQGHGGIHQFHQS